MLSCNTHNVLYTLHYVNGFHPVERFFVRWKSGGYRAVIGSSFGACDRSSPLPWCVLRFAGFQQDQRSRGPKLAIGLRVVLTQDWGGASSPGARGRGGSPIKDWAEKPRIGGILGPKFCWKPAKRKTHYPRTYPG